MTKPNLPFLLTGLFLGFFSLGGFAVESTIIKGTAPEYAGKSIVLKTYEDYITYQEVELDTLFVDSTGKFESTLSIDHSRMIFSHLGIYFAYFYVTPGNVYEIMLPKRKDRDVADKLNPFFQESPLHLGVKNEQGTRLNFLISAFDDYFIPYFKKFAFNSRSRESYEELDTLIAKIEAPFKDEKNLFFQTYLRYKIGMLRQVAFQSGSRNTTSMFFHEKEVHYYHPAYMELFNMVFDDYFIHFSRTENGKGIYNFINDSACYSCLSGLLASDSALADDTLRELVILKNLHDNFYDDQFSRSGMLTVLDSLIHQTRIENHRDIGLTIREKVTKLMVNFEPPNFTLLDRDSNLVSLDDLKGKYVYLNFCMCLSYGCIRDFERLSKLYEKHNEYLKIVTVALDEEYETMTNFLSGKDYSWLFLHYGRQPDIINDYDLRAFPVYFLIGPDGELLKSPAPSPEENFELYLFRIMREKGDI